VCYFIRNSSIDKGGAIANEVSEIIHKVDLLEGVVATRE
jgi:hypothetical protein